MPEEEVNSLPDQPGTWFLNRGLFSDHFLKARLPQWKEWQPDAALAALRNQLLSLYDSKKAILPLSSEAQTEEEFVRPVLDLLGYADAYIVQAPTQVGKHTNRPDYALFPDETAKNKAYKKLKSNDYTQCIGVADAKYWERELDLAKSSERDTFTNQNPSFQIASYLTGTKQTWGILTNGRLWRLYCAKSHLPLGNYYQVDLVQLLQKAPEEGLKYFYLFFGKAALIQVDGKSFLDRVLEDSNQYAVELEADIKERAYEVVQVLCGGFAADSRLDQLTGQTLKTIYDNSLTLLYRLLFVFYAEARELLPLTANQSYREKYSIHRLTQEIDETLAKGYPLSPKSSIYYQRTSTLFKLINQGDPVLGVPEYNGGLFDPEEHPFLEEHAIADAFLVQAIRQLAWIADKKLGCQVAVDYNTLSERHLGSVYEGLLEFRPRVAASDLVPIKDKGSIRYAPADKHPDKEPAYKKGELYLANDKGERKASGSYYTPEYIVNYIVENTLDPLVEEAHEKVKALRPEVGKAIAKWEKLKQQKQGLEPTDKYDRKITEERERLLEPYLSLKVLDPAMGSGHFLARATDFLAEAIATDPYIKPPSNMGEDSELTYYRRRAVESCIYGVDLNPLAVELAKLTLWLGTMAKSKPLSFLNHHLRVGNSLIGARVTDLDEVPKAKAKKGKAIDLKRAPIQIGQFEWAFNQELAVSLKSRAMIGHLPTETLEDVHNKEKWEQDFQHNMRRFHTLADLWASTYFGNSVPWDEYNTLVENLQSLEPEWAKLLQKKSVQQAVAMSEERRFFHWELEFPEVFYDEKGNHKPTTGFDAVIGNPPYSARLDSLDRSFAEMAFPTSTADKNTAIQFIELCGNLVLASGMCGLIVPKSLTFSGGWEQSRSYLCKRVRTLVDVSRAFEGVLLEQVVVVYGGSAALHDTYLASLAVRDSISQPIEVHKELWQTTANWPIGISKQELETLKRIRDRCSTLASISETFRGLPFQGVMRDSGRIPVFRGDDISRYTLFPPSKFVNEEDIQATEKRIERLRQPKIMSQNIVAHVLTPRPHIIIMSYYDEQGALNLDTVNNTVVTAARFSPLFVAALLNSRLVSWYTYVFIYNRAIRTMHFDAPYVGRIPLPHVDFSLTSDERNNKEVDALRELYEKALSAGDADQSLRIAVDHLRESQAPAEVLHDFLAMLSGRMLDLCRRKQNELAQFRDWLRDMFCASMSVRELEAVIAKEPGESELFFKDIKQKGVRLSQDDYAQVKDSFQRCSEKVSSMSRQSRTTDTLLDRAVYRIYGLEEAEIEAIERVFEADVNTITAGGVA